MPSRSALMVTDAAGPETVVAGILKRFDFAVPQRVPTVAAAIERMRTRQVDLVFVPLDRLTPDELQALEAEVRTTKPPLIIGTAPAADPQLILRGVRAGIQEFLVRPVEAGELTAAMERLVKRTPVDVRRGKVVAVHSSKGGLGNTSIAVNLAYAFAQQRPSARVAVVDLVIASGDVRVFLDLEPAYHLGDLVGKLDRADGELLQTLLTPGPGEQVMVLPGPDDPELEDVLDATAVGGVLDRLRAHYDYVVVDCEHHMSERTLAAMDAADTILLVTQLNVAALKSTQRTVALCQRLGHGPDKLLVVVNRFEPDGVLSLGDAKKVLTNDVFATLPNNWVLAFEALTHGVPLSQLAPGAPLTRGIAALAAKLEGATATAADGEPESRSKLGRLMGMIRGA